MSASNYENMITKKCIVRSKRIETTLEMKYEPHSRCWWAKRGRKRPVRRPGANSRGMVHSVLIKCGTEGTGSERDSRGRDGSDRGAGWSAERLTRGQSRNSGRIIICAAWKCGAVREIDGRRPPGARRSRHTLRLKATKPPVTGLLCRNCMYIR